MSDVIVDHTTTVPSSLRVTDRSVSHAEWIKFRSVRSNVITVLAAGVALVVFAGLFSYFAGGDGPGPGDDGGVSDSLSVSFAGINLAQLVLGVLGALFVAGEYSTGMIRTMFAAVAERVPVLRGKAFVIAGVTWLVMTVAAFAAFFTGQALYGGDGATYGLWDDGVLRVVLGVGVYGMGVAVMGVALGFLLRSTAGAIATLVGVLLIAPGLIGLLPDSISEAVTKILPSEAGAAFMDLHPSSGSLSPWAGLAVFAGWVVALLAAAAWSLRHRDA